MKKQKGLEFLLKCCHRRQPVKILASSGGNILASSSGCDIALWDASNGRTQYTESLEEIIYALRRSSAINLAPAQKTDDSLFSYSIRGGRCV
jgi:WD40 repeat protein